MHAKFHRWITDIGKKKVVAFVGYEEGSNYDRVTRVIATQLGRSPTVQRSSKIVKPMRESH